MSEDLQKYLPEVYKSGLDFLGRIERGDIPKSDAAKEKAKQIIGDSDASATAVYCATAILFGDTNFLAWEPESIWLEYQDHSVDPPAENRDKLQAAMTMHMGNAVYWDALFFEKVVVALNGNPADAETIQEASPGEVAWGTFEIQLLEHAFGSNEEYDHEPTRYTALTLYRAGFALAPETIVFAQEELDKLNKDPTLATRVSEAWGMIAKDKIEDSDFDESPLGVQLAKLGSVHLYVGNRARNLLTELQALA